MHALLPFFHIPYNHILIHFWSPEALEEDGFSPNEEIRPLAFATSGCLATNHRRWRARYTPNSIPACVAGWCSDINLRFIDIIW